MARFEIKALDEYVDLLASVPKKKDKIIKSALYEGANIVADEIRKEMNSLQVVSHGVYDEKAGRYKIGMTDIEKKDILDGFGISPMEKKNGEINVKLGFDGYGHRTRKYPNGIPITILAGAIIHGTSFRHKNDFMRRAVNRSKKKAINEMDQTINKEFEKELKNNG